MASGSNDDPRCPECGEPVGVTSTYCMHCGAEFEENERLDDSADITDTDDVSLEDAPGETERIPDVGDDSPEVAGGGDTGRGGSDGTGPAGGAGTSTMDRVVDGFRRGLGPDGFIDDSLTVLLGLVAGVVIGFGTLFVVGITTGSAVSALVGLAAWLLSTVVIARQRTVLGALRLSCYAVAALLLLGPVAALSPEVGVDGGVWDRIVLFVIAEVAVAIPAAIIAVIGYAAGKARPDSVVEDGTAA